MSVEQHEKGVMAEYIIAQVDRPPVGDSTTHIAGMRFDIDF